MAEPQMIVELHDVNHGQCAMVTAPNGAQMMIDCGTRFEEGDGPWYPSITYRGCRPELLVLQNLDRDHLDDLEDVLQHVCPQNVLTNPTIDSSRLRAIKEKTGGLGNGGLAVAANLLDRLVPRSSPMTPYQLWAYLTDPLMVRWQAFWNNYGDFTDTNNLSVALFVTFGSFKILFPGDLEAAGWRHLLANPVFRQELSGTSVLVASHHGRENGYCPEVFDYCRPSIIIISDGRIEYDTQKTVGRYADRVTGIPDKRTSGGLLGYPTRKVLTTRKDGTIRIEVETTGAWTAYLENGPEPEPTFGLAVAAYLDSLAALPSPLYPPGNSLFGLAANSFVASPPAGSTLYDQIAKALSPAPAPVPDYSALFEQRDPSIEKILDAVLGPNRKR